MTYVEFPFDQIIDLHVKKKDDPPPIDPDNDPGVLCGELYNEISVGVPLGLPEWHGSYMRLLTTGGIIFDYAKYVQAGFVDENGNPIYDIPVDDYMVPMENVIRYDISWQVTCYATFSGGTLGGAPVSAVIGSGIGLGVSNTGNTPGFGDIGSNNGLPYYPSPSTPNLGASIGGDLVGAGSSISMALSASYDVKKHGIGALWTGGIGSIVALHNVNTEPAPPEGWEGAAYGSNSSGFFQITGFCPTPETGTHGPPRVVRREPPTSRGGSVTKW